MHSERRSSASAAWLSGLVLGAVGGIGVLEVGFLGLGFLVVALGLIAWKGPRVLAAAGFATGFGVIWAVLFLRVQWTCGPGAPLPDSGCVSEDLSPWIAGSGLVFVAGLVASAVAFRRTTTERRQVRDVAVDRVREADKERAHTHDG
jgi:hypothetical protein